MKIVNFLIWIAVVFFAVNFIPLNKKSVKVSQKLSIQEEVDNELPVSVIVCGKLISEKNFQDLLGKNQKLREQFYMRAGKKLK